MKRNFRRTVSLLCALALCIGLLPMAALAEDTALVPSLDGTSDATGGGGTSSEEGSTSTTVPNDLSGTDPLAVSPEVQAFLDAVAALPEEIVPEGQDTAAALVEAAEAAYAALSEIVLTEEETAAVEQALTALETVRTALDALDSSADPAALAPGVSIITEGASGATYDIGDGAALMISGQQAGQTAPIVFTDCTFLLSGGTVRISGDQDGISYNNGEVVTKLWIGGNVRFDNCTFQTAQGATKTTSAGYDAAIYFFSGDIVLNSCTLTAEGYNGQFLGLYGSSGSVTFSDCDISTVGNQNGWSYAMYAGSVLKLLDGSTLSATGMSVDSGNTNAFYSGDNRTGYDAIYIEDSHVDFSDNQAGGFAINNVNIHVTDSTINVSDNLGNACNSGYWIVDGSTITMNGNRGGHALSCIGFEMTDSTLEILHNGYAGIYIQSRDSSLTRCTVDLRCNGERLLSYTAGDLWVGRRTSGVDYKYDLTIDSCTSVAQPGSAWLGAVGRMGSVTTTEGSSVVAYDLNSNAADNLKSNTEPVLTSAAIALDGEENTHTLLLDPFMTSDYARGNGESTAGSNDVDLFEDDRVDDPADILGAGVAKIGTLTDAQLSHHRYDWTAGEVRYEATEAAYGALAYPCADVCGDYIGQTGSHPNSFDCAGTYVYAPLVGLAFDANLPTGTGSVLSVYGMPEAQTTITYGGTGTRPDQIPAALDNSDDYNWVFAGWTADPEGTAPYDFTTPLTENWTVVYAQWERVEAGEGSLTISKTVNGTTDEQILDQSFGFTVTFLADGAYPYFFNDETTPAGTITSGGTVALKNGQTVSINGIPAGTVYTVSEAVTDGFVTTVKNSDGPSLITTYREDTVDATGTIVANTASVVHYVNTYQTPEPPAVPGLSVRKALTEVNARPYIGGQVESGDALTYTITVTNTGGTVLTGITVADALPAGLRLTSADSSWTVASLDPGQSRTVTLTAVVRSTAEGQLLTNTVTAAAGDLTATDSCSVRVEDSYTPVPIPDPDPDPTPDPGGEDDDDPEGLNTEDHVAYLIGFTDGTIRPEASITRAEVATIFFRLLTDGAREQYWSQTNPYPDVDSDDWYNNAISTLTNMGILTGYDNGSFGPTDSITRAEFTTIAVRFFQSAYDYGYTGGYSDVDGTEWYARYVAAATALGLVEGMPDGTFRPLASITRAEAATIVNRTLGRAPHEDHLLPWAQMITWPDNSSAQAWYYEAMQEATNSHDYTWTEEDGQTVEGWTEKLEERDWAALEREWSNANSAPGGEVMD